MDSVASLPRTSTQGVPFTDYSETEIGRRGTTSATGRYLDVSRDHQDSHPWESRDCDGTEVSGYCWTTRAYSVSTTGSPRETCCTRSSGTFVDTSLSVTRSRGALTTRGAASTGGPPGVGSLGRILVSPTVGNSVVPVVQKI